MKYKFMALVLTLFSTSLQAGVELPQSINFTLSAQVESEISSKQFCKIQAVSMNEVKIFTKTTGYESLGIICDGKTFTMAGEVSSFASDRRVNEILSQTMSQFLKMGYSVVSCEKDNGFYTLIATCTVAKHVLPR